MCLQACIKHCDATRHPWPSSPSVSPNALPLPNTVGFDVGNYATAPDWSDILQRHTHGYAYLQTHTSTHKNTHTHTHTQTPVNAYAQTVTHRHARFHKRLDETHFAYVLLLSRSTTYRPHSPYWYIWFVHYCHTCTPCLQKKNTFICYQTMHDIFSCDPNIFGAQDVPGIDNSDTCQLRTWRTSAPGSK